MSNFLFLVDMSILACLLGLVGNGVLRLFCTPLKNVLSCIVVGEALLVVFSFFFSQIHLIHWVTGVALVLILLGVFPFLKRICRYSYCGWPQEGAEAVRRLASLDSQTGIFIPIAGGILIMSLGIFHSSPIRHGDIWGTSDFFIYWATANFLRHYPFSHTSYLTQAEFHHLDIYEHLAFYGRGGSMSLLASLANLSYFPPFWGRTDRLINPLIELNQLIAVIILSREFSRSFYYPRVASFLIASSPLLLFPLYFTYFSQAVSLPLVLLPLSILRKQRLGDVGEFSVLSLILLAGSLVYEVTAPLFVFIQLGITIKFCRAAPLTIARASLILLACCLFSFNFTTVLMRMLRLGVTQDFPGWDWSRPPGLPCALGIVSPLKNAPLVLPLLALLLLNFAVLMAIYTGAKNKPVFLLPLVFSALLALPALSLMFLNVPHSSHMWVKSMTLTGPLLTTYALLGLQKIWTDAFGRSKSLLWLFLVICVGEFSCVGASLSPRIILPEELSELVRNIPAPVDRIFISSNLEIPDPIQAISPITGSDRIFEEGKGKECPDKSDGSKSFFIYRVACSKGERNCFVVNKC